MCNFVFFSIIFFDDEVVELLDEFLIADEFFGDESIRFIQGGVEGFIFAAGSSKRLILKFVVVVGECSRIGSGPGSVFLETGCHGF